MEKTTKAQPTKGTDVARKRRFEGTVMTISGNKTVKVKVENMKLHPKYNKQYKQSSNFAVHDEKGIASVGDRVVIQECRPLSKMKRWFVVEKIEHKQ